MRLLANYLKVAIEDMMLMVVGLHTHLPPTHTLEAYVQQQQVEQQRVTRLWHRWRNYNKDEDIDYKAI
jgi:hypothetical protein